MSKKKVKNQPKVLSPYTKLVPYAIVCVFIFIIYGNSLENAFHFDDEISIHNNQDIKSFEYFKSLKTWTQVQERPFSYFTLAINYAMGGLDSKSYHWFNMLFHMMASMLVFVLAGILLQLTLPNLASRKRMALALAMALFFASHTIQVMAVAYVVQRMTILATLFYLWSVWLYIKARRNHIQTGLNSRTAMLYVATFATALLAILSKQNAATLPLLWLLSELFFIRSTEGKMARKYLLLSGGVLLLGFIGVLVFGLLPKETNDISRGVYLISQFKVLVLYLQLLFFPSGFNIDHNIQPSDNLWGILELLGLFLTLGLLSLSILWYKKYRLISFGILWFFITLSLESSIIPITDLMMEQRLYLPLFGFSLAISMALFVVLKENMVRFMAIIILISIILGVTTYQRNFDWKTNQSIWLKCLEETPNNTRALVYVGRSMAVQDPHQALNYFNQSIAVDSNYYHGWFNRGLIYYDKRNYDEALDNFNRALSIEGLHHDYIYYLMGASYLYKKEYGDAISYLDQYINKNPNDPKAFMFRGEAHYFKGNYLETASDFKSSLNLDASTINLYLNLVEVYYKLGDKEQMRYHIEIAKQKGLTVPVTYTDFIQE